MRKKKERKKEREKCQIIVRIINKMMVKLGNGGWNVIIEEKIVIDHFPPNFNNKIVSLFK